MIYCIFCTLFHWAFEKRSQSQALPAGLFVTRKRANRHQPRSRKTACRARSTRASNVFNMLKAICSKTASFLDMTTAHSQKVLLLRPETPWRQVARGPLTANKGAAENWHIQGASVSTRNRNLTCIDRKLDT